VQHWWWGQWKWRRRTDLCTREKRTVHLELFRLHTRKLGNRQKMGDEHPCSAKTRYITNRIWKTSYLKSKIYGSCTLTMGCNFLPNGKGMVCRLFGWDGPQSSSEERVLVLDTCSSPFLFFGILAATRKILGELICEEDTVHEYLMRKLKRGPVNRGPVLPSGGQARWSIDSAVLAGLCLCCAIQTVISNNRNPHRGFPGF